MPPSALVMKSAPLKLGTFPSGAETYTLRREGFFAAEPVGPDHCGTGHAEFGYEVRITTSDLDQQGFVVDTLAINDVIQRDNKISLSCEQHAQRIARIVVGLIPNDLHDGLQSLQVMVFAHNPDVPRFGEAYFNWKRSMNDS